MATAGTLKLEPATLEDAPAIAELWFAAFTDPDMRHLFPDTPGFRQWWIKANHDDMINKPFQKYLKVVDTEATDEQGRPRMVAYAKWDLSTLSDRGRRYPPWHEDQPADECEAFFSGIDQNRIRIMGDLKHYYLDMLGTHPDYRKRGAGSMLVQWGCDLADREGVAAYLDASKAGAPLYEKFGFVDHSPPGSKSLVASMARK
ncbi:hypothetical protein PEBR_36034 [Penicillium brasilianum]|uniref:N-acetyltransferase domain-containing protein n=1 Tax=Penicillium brasilianum TaxID=104259 RepID=A0A1S9RF47_PENBI|nr:hypothetical protein PEBR_36034 [Penicillium brasilianum]